MRIGSTTIENNVFLAPMAGVTDKAFRLLARQAGCGLTYTEMVSAKALTYTSRKTFSLLDLSGEPRPTAVQIFGSDPEIMAVGARMAQEAGAGIIDINMGCPTPKIVKNGEGCALMCNVALAAAIAGAVVRAVSAPVTVKMRKGWDAGSVNAVQLARALESEGVSAVTVHGRTREQFYSGEADWDIVRAVRESVALPVIGNGDIRSPEDALAMLQKTGCHAVMIGRGAMGNPWLLEQTVAYLQWGKLIPPPSARERLRVARDHLRLVVELKGEKTGLLEMRKHLAWYMKGLPGAARLREKINRTESLKSLLRLLDFFERELT